MCLPWLICPDLSHLKMEKKKETKEDWRLWTTFWSIFENSACKLHRISSCYNCIKVYSSLHSGTSIQVHVTKGQGTGKTCLLQQGFIVSKPILRKWISCIETYQQPSGWIQILVWETSCGFALALYQTQHNLPKQSLTFPSVSLSALSPSWSQ